MPVLVRPRASGLQLVALLPLLMGCLHAPAAPPVNTARRVVQLLPKTPERETSTWPEVRSDVVIDTRDFDRTPHVVASAQSPVLELQGAHARLYGDAAAGSEGWSVDNVLLLEVEEPGGKVIDRMVVGFSDPVVVDGETIDNVGRRSFTFDPGEIDLTSRLPADKPFKLRATALDYSGVGRTSELFLVLEPAGKKAPHEDDLRGQ